MQNKLAWNNYQHDDLLRQLDIALEVSGIGIWLHKINVNQTHWDDQMQRLYGIHKAENDVVWMDSIHPADRDSANDVFRDAIIKRSDYASQFRILLPNGSIRHLRSRAKFFTDAQGEDCFIGAEWDVTEDVMKSEQLAKEREAAELSRAEARYVADHDYLTGLLNRRAFDDCFQRLSGDQNVEVLSLSHIDIDHFKAINDRFGHLGGDEVLAYVGRVLSTTIKQPDIAARLGGDEFAVISSGDALHLQNLVDRIYKELHQPIPLGSDYIDVGCSIGIAEVERAQATDLLRFADLALYEAKRTGRNRAEIFTPSLLLRLNREKLLLQELKTAISTGGIVAYYQPQVTARDHQICGLEALARWETSDGLLFPKDFMEIASANGLVEAIDDAILQQVLLDVETWRAAGIVAPNVSVNISAARLNDPNLAEKLSFVDAAANRISFELVETIFLDKIGSQAKANIDYIRSLGIAIELDDLGSGHASLLALIELRPDKVKIDRHLIAPVVEDITQRNLVASLVDIARTLKLEIVAEGVETLQHAEILTDLGVDILQGFAFGRAEASSVISQNLTKHHQIMNKLPISGRS